MAQAKQDMGSGSVKKLMLQLMIPAVVAQVVNLLYNIVDRIYIGHIEGIGAAALTGVGLFTPILMLHRHCTGAGGPAAGRKDHLQQLYGADALCSGADHRLLCGCARAAAAVRCQ